VWSFSQFLEKSFDSTKASWIHLIFLDFFRNLHTFGDFDKYNIIRVTLEIRSVLLLPPLIGLDFLFIYAVHLIFSFL
jgi:hypothetical protein